MSEIILLNIHERNYVICQPHPSYLKSRCIYIVPISMDFDTCRTSPSTDTQQ